MPLNMPKLLKDSEAASILGLAPQTLAEWRCSKAPYAPKHVKIGRAVRYRLQDLEEYINHNIVSN